MNTCRKVSLQIIFLDDDIALYEPYLSKLSALALLVFPCFEIALHFCIFLFISPRFSPASVMCLSAHTGVYIYMNSPSPRHGVYVVLIMRDMSTSFLYLLFNIYRYFVATAPPPLMAATTEAVCVTREMTAQALCDSHHVGCLCTFSTLIKKTRKFSSYIRKFRMKQLQRSYMTITASSYEYMGKYLRISSYIRKPCATLQLLHSEILYRWGKLDFLFYQCNRPPATASGIARRSQLSSLRPGQTVRSIKAGGVDQKRFIDRLLARHGCLPVWLVAAWYSSGSGHGPTWTSRTEVGVLKKLSVAGIAKLSRLKYRWLRFVWPEPTIGWCTQPVNSQLILQSSMKYLGFSRLSLAERG
jgi:hypothetical protein